MNCKAKRTLFLVFWFGIGFFCLLIQQDYLYSTILPENMYELLGIGWFFLCAFVVYLYLLKTDTGQEYWKSLPLRERIVRNWLLKAVISTFFAVVWIPVCLVVALHINALGSRQKQEEFRVFKIEAITINGRAAKSVSPEYINITVRNIFENNKLEELFLPLRNENKNPNATMVGVTYRRGLFGWKILTKKTVFMSGTIEIMKNEDDEL